MKKAAELKILLWRIFNGFCYKDLETCADTLRGRTFNLFCGEKKHYP